jgi:hypothetical protein
MPDQKVQPETLHPMLRFPWWRHGDPVPDFIFQYLDKAILMDLAVAQLEAQREILQSEGKLAERSIAILKQMK